MCAELTTPPSLSRGRGASARVSVSLDSPAGSWLLASHLVLPAPLQGGAWVVWPPLSLGCVISGHFFRCGLCSLECSSCADCRSTVLSPLQALFVGGDKLGVWGRRRVSRSAQVWQSSCTPLVCPPPLPKPPLRICGGTMYPNISLSERCFLELIISLPQPSPAAFPLMTEDPHFRLLHPQTSQCSLLLEAL